MRKPSSTGLDIDLQGGLSEAETPHAGVALLIELGRRSGVVGAAERHLPRKKSVRGVGQGQFVESVVVLSALGGDCLDDFDGLRRDRGLAALLGYELPAASTARQWLDRFHDPQAVRDRPRQGSFIPPESAGLAGLRAVVQHSVRTYVTAVQPGPAVTLDVDAHLVESSKRSALPTYEGFRGYQPLLVAWAEAGLVLADEFRDGNVPASVGIRGLVDEAFASLPGRSDGEPWQVSVRSDSAAYEQDTLDHWQERGWRFAVSADLSPQLRREIVALPFDAWQPWATEAKGVVREWAEVAYVPSRRQEQREGQPSRYLAIRVRTPQGVLFGDGSTVKHFAVVTNDWTTEGQALLQWQRGKAGTIEHVHRVLKDELAAGVYPSDKFGANAAWLRLQVLTHNLLELLKATALEPQERHARPKRLRFAIFTQFGRVVHHAHQRFLRLVTRVLEAVLRPGLRRVRACAWAAP
ncbi:MAG: IS1380 family transposase [Dehalococcoidia bacterium]|nr:IS1380 family transposase [Dehalococcoidia bacterium]